MPDPTLPGGPPQGPGDGPRRPGLSQHPGPPYPSLQALQAGALARSIRAGERYLDALKVQEATTRATQLSYLTREARQDATRVSHATPESLAARQRYQAALAARPQYTLRQGLTPEERLWVHTVATMPYEFALMARYDPVVRSVGGAVIVVGAVEAAPAVYMAGEDLVLEGLESSASYLDAEGTALYDNFAAVTLRSFVLKASVNAAGQGIGNYLVTRDLTKSVNGINGLSVVASGLNVPLGYNSLFSAGFSYTRTNGFKSVATGDISAYEFGRDAAFNYGFGKVSAGFKLGGRSILGLDKLYTTQPVSQSIGFATYQAMLRTGPRIGYGLGLSLSTGLEHGNKIVVGATKKYLAAKLKEKLPDPAKAKAHGK